jgi:Protein of unknown function (DUF3152)
MPDGEGARIRRLRRRKQRQRRRRIALAAGLVVLATVAAVVGLVRLHPTRHPARASGPVPGPASSPPPSFPSSGPGTFSYAPASAEVLGAGTAAVRTYRVAVEDGTGQDVGAFAQVVRTVLADPRGWTAGGDVRFQQVAVDAKQVAFTLTLATPATVERACVAGGIHTDQYLSCRLPGQLMINLGRWLTGVPGYGGPIDEYRAYEINYAVGRELGHSNEGCPGRGQPAPVMQKQVLGLKGCTANGWPYRNGQRYTGPVVP